MVIRGGGGGIYVQAAAPSRRRPDWDNTVRDLKTLKLTAAELDARSRAFKSKDWSRPRKFSSDPSPELGGSKNGEDDGVAAKLAMHKIKVRRDFLALKKKNILSSCSNSSSGGDDGDDGDDGDNDFEEDIRRLESLQSRQLLPRSRTPPEVRNRPGVACDAPNSRGSPNLLQYLEAEIQKAWSDMKSAKKKKPQRQRKKVKRKLKLQIGHKKKDQEMDNVKVLSMILASQKTTALSANQSFVKELQKHVQYQENVIHELNEFRISATKELTNLVVLVQKLLNIQESKMPVVALLGGSDDGNKAVVEEKPRALTKNPEPTGGAAQAQDMEDGVPVNHHNGTPPKPREVPAFLMRRAGTISKKPSSARPLQLNQAFNLRDRPELTKPPPDSKHLELAQAKVAENKRRLYQRSTEELAKEGEVTSDEFDRRENPLFESDMRRKMPAAISRGPFKKSRLHEQSSSPTWNLPSSPAWKPRQAQHVAAAEKPSSPTFRGRTQAQLSTVAVIEQPKARQSGHLAAVTCREQSSSPTRKGRQNALAAAQEQTSSPPLKAGRVQAEQQPLSPAWRGRRSQLQPAAATSLGNAEDRGKKSTICIPVRKPISDEHRVVIPVTRKKTATVTMQPSGAQLAESRVDFQNKKPPRYKLQRWSAALAQSDKSRGKENNVRTHS